MGRFIKELYQKTQLAILTGFIVAAIVLSVEKFSNKKTEDEIPFFEVQLTNSPRDKKVKKSLRSISEVSRELGLVIPTLFPFTSPNPSVHLTTNFTVGEFTKNGTRPFPNQTTYWKCQQLSKALEVIREYYGKPVIITSGIRTPEINRQIGGAPLSQHVSLPNRPSCAVDFIVVDVDHKKVFKDFGQFWSGEVGGIGLYSEKNGTTHIDLRAVPTSWDWSNR